MIKVLTFFAWIMSAQLMFAQVCQNPFPTTGPKNSTQFYFSEVNNLFSGPPRLALLENPLQPISPGTPFLVGSCSGSGVVLCLNTSCPAMTIQYIGKATSRFGLYDCNHKAIALFQQGPSSDVLEVFAPNDNNTSIATLEALDNGPSSVIIRDNKANVVANATRNPQGTWEVNTFGTSLASDPRIISFATGLRVTDNFNCALLVLVLIGIALASTAGVLAGIAAGAAVIIIGIWTCGAIGLTALFTVNIVRTVSLKQLCSGFGQCCGRVFH